MMFCHVTIIDSVIIYTSSTPNELVVKDSNDTQKSASYISIYDSRYDNFLLYQSPPRHLSNT
jgi:hypothetical protein